MSKILNTSEVMDCLFDSDIDVSDLLSDNNSFVDNDDEDPVFLPCSSNSNKLNSIINDSSSSSSDFEGEVPAVSFVVSPNVSRQSLGIPSPVTVNHPFFEPQWDKSNEVFTNPVILSDSNLAPHIVLMEHKTPYNLFLEMFPESLIDIILFQTNLYAKQSQKPYTPATKHEIKTFLESSSRTWSSAPDMNDPYISKHMTVNRFGWFLSNIHCND